LVIYNSNSQESQSVLSVGVEPITIRLASTLALCLYF
jgi:hypothetical protein